MLLLLLSIPLVLGLVPPNRVYGFRTARTLADRGLWRRANRLGGALAMGASLCYLVVARLFPMPPPGSGDLPVYALHVGSFVVPLLAAGLAVWAYARRS